MSLRVLALVTEAYGGRGGIAQYNRDLFDALSACDEMGGIDVLPRLAPEPVTSFPKKVRQSAAHAGRAAFGAAALRHVATRRDYDVVFCGHLFMVPLAALLGRALGVPVWLQLHGVEAWQAPSGVQRAAAERCALVTVVSRHTRRKVQAWCDLPPERLVVLPNTVHERFRPRPDPVELRRRLGLDQKRVLLTVSRLASSERYKGHDRVIAALATLRLAHPELTYLIAGEGDDRGRLERRCRDAGVHDAVRFLGHVPDDELPELYRLADAYVMPSTGEGFGIVFLEAQRCGTPVIAARGDASSDPLRDGAGGILVDPGEPGELVEAVERCLSGSAPVDSYDAFGVDGFRRHVRRIVQEFVVPLAP